MSEFQSAAPAGEEGGINDTSSSNYRFVCAHEEMNPRRRNTMEDVHRIVGSLPGAAEYSYLGVYDGHGGRQIVDYLEEGLEINVSTELQQPDEASVLDRMTRAFLITDMHSRRLNITTSGATAVVALIKTTFSSSSLHAPAAPAAAAAAAMETQQTETQTEAESVGSGGGDCAPAVESKTLYVANVGDSRAVLALSDPSSASGYRALRLSYDHRAEDEGEQRRIKDAGGFITRGRVLGILAVSRSFGDHGMKDFVTAEPYVTETNLLTCSPDGSADCPILILACDGVWDVLSDQEALDLVLPQYKESGPYAGAAKLLVDTAIEKGSADNITAIVVFL
jgi:serine/threonine protein phosphatase PrpC